MGEGAVSTLALVLYTYRDGVLNISGYGVLMLGFLLWLLLDLFRD